MKIFRLKIFSARTLLSTTNIPHRLLFFPNSTTPPQNPLLFLQTSMSGNVVMSTQQIPQPVVNQAQVSNESDGLTKEVRGLMKSQRRVRGVITNVGDGRCVIHSEFGIFPFDRRSVKVNKNHPQRSPQKGDPCEFRLTEQKPVFAVSIRVSVPRTMDPDAMRVCYTMLEQACGGITPLVYQVEGATTRHAVCIIYLSARIVDTFSEHARDLVAAFPGMLQDNEATLSPALQSYTYIVQDPLERSLLQALPHVVSLLHALPAHFTQAVIQGIRLRCEALMAQHQSNKGEPTEGGEPDSLLEYTSLCNCLGGTMAEALGLIFSAQMSGPEGKGDATPLDSALARHTGIFLMKCHSVRMQYVGGLSSGARWPKELKKTLQGEGMTDEEGNLLVLRTMIDDAISHASKAVAYLVALSQLKSGLHPFKFTAVQVTLALAQISILWGTASVMNRGSSIGREACAKLMALRTPQEAVSNLLLATQTLRVSIAPTDTCGPSVLSHINQTEAALLPLQSFGI